MTMPRLPRTAPAGQVSDVQQCCVAGAGAAGVQAGGGWAVGRRTQGSCRPACTAVQPLAPILHAGYIKKWMHPSRQLATPRLSGKVGLGGATGAGDCGRALIKRGLQRGDLTVKNLPPQPSSRLKPRGSMPPSSLTAAPAGEDRRANKSGSVGCGLHGIWWAMHWLGEGWPRMLAKVGCPCLCL